MAEDKDIKSPSWLRDRKAAHRWLKNTADGKMAVRNLQENMPGGDLSSVLDNKEQWKDWEGMIEEHRNGLQIAGSCQELRNAADLARQARSNKMPPIGNHGKWLRFFAPPMWYVLRKQVEVADPDYWNYPVNVMREALEHPQWATIPLDMIRGELNQLMSVKEREGMDNGKRKLPSGDTTAAE